MKVHPIPERGNRNQIRHEISFSPGKSFFSPLYPAVQRRNFLKWRSRCRKSRSDLESKRGRKERSSAWIVAV